MTKPNEFHYLASPYSHVSPKVRAERYLLARNAMYYLWTEGTACVSAIALCHELAQDLKLPKDYPFWKRVNGWFINICSDFTILLIDGWKESRGVNGELYQAAMLGKPIHYFNPGTHEFKEPTDV